MKRIFVEALFSEGGIFAFVALPVVIWFFINLGVAAGAEPEAKSTFCKFGPDTVEISAKKDSQSAEPCIGTVHIQARMFGCVQNKDVSQTTQRFYRDVVNAGRSVCREHCQNRAPGCLGRFVAPPKCALQIDTEHALASGKSVGCRSDCEGPALAFCSLYAAGMMKVDESLVVQSAPNCFCHF